METESSNLSDRTPVPLKWLFGVCSVFITAALLYASAIVGEIREEIARMSASVNSLNVSVAVMLKEQSYTRTDLEDLKKRVTGLEQSRRR